MKEKYSLISLSILTILYSDLSLAELGQQCLLGVPHFTGQLVEGDPNKQPIYIEADKAIINQPSSAIYEGNVDIKQGNRHLKTQIAEVIQQGEGKNTQRYAKISDGFDYKDNLIKLDGYSAKVHLNSKDTDIDQANYHFIDRQGRGKAQHVELRNNYREMHDAEFTSCLQGDNSWSIKAKEMRQYVKEEYAEMWHAYFLVHGVPIFYTPYLQLPIGDRRRSGLLLPNIGTSSRDGYFYEQPIYWNISENYDATITPKYMSNRGWQLKSEFRYLTSLGEGNIAGEYINKDRLDDYIFNNSRHLLHWTHNSSFLENWRVNIDYTRVSDNAYFNDFTSDYGNSTDGYADQKISISYYKPNYNISISAKKFQIFDDIDIGPYRVLPQINFNYYKNNLLNKNLDFNLFVQTAHFNNKSSLMPSAWRFHMEPSLNIPISMKYGIFNFESKFYATHYNQKKGKNIRAEDIQNSVNRFLPQIKVDFQTILTSDKNLFSNYIQTIEPHIQYLYRPYRDQSNIGSKLNSEYLGFGYDSSLLQQDYFSLFRDRRYSGLDRISSANQVTLGGTTRFYDKNIEERFNISLGQTYYLNNSRIDANPSNSTKGTSSSWALESNWKINNQWNWRGSYQYDTRLKEASLANLTLEYNPEKDNLIQLNYRFASQSYIDQNLNSNINRYNQDIKQLGLTIAWELNDNWAIVGRYYQDIALSKAVEQYIGLQYSTCCWSVGLGSRRYLTNKINREYINDKDAFYNNSIGVSFELRGLGSNHSSNIRNMLEKGMLPYIKPFNL